RRHPHSFPTRRSSDLTDRFQARGICCKRARVLVPILVQTKLQWIDKNAGDYQLAIALGNLHQFNMRIMQIAHRGHKSDTLARFRSEEHTSELQSRENL